MHNWSSDQLTIIQGPADARVLVIAGPGTGKTAVACARIAHLIDEQDVVPSKVMLVSFTRTAVQELRDRIVRGAVHPEAARSVQISTIDSKAWHLRHNFEAEETKNLSGAVTFHSNLERLLSLLREEDPGVLEFLERRQHLVVDEAQDVVGLRAQLLLALLRNLSDACGITVFADHAQAIYGFTTDGDDSNGSEDVAFLDLLERSSLSMETRHLTRIYRGADRTIIDLFVSTRKELLRERSSPERYQAVREAARSHAAGPLNGRHLQELKECNGALVLFRRRGEALLASSFLSSEGVEHRLRMSGLPVVVQPWIGLLLSDHVEPILTREEFRRRWKIWANHPIICVQDESQCWANLYRHAPHGTGVKMLRVRELLALDRPPVSLCQPDVGVRGPVISTIHASKGRQADRVRLMLQHAKHHDWCEVADLDEESRVIYVGATRARQVFEVGQGYRCYATSLRSGRIYERKSGAFQIQIGMHDDVDPMAHARRHDAPAVQELLRRFASETTPLDADLSEQAGWSYELTFKGGDEVIGRLSQAVNHDLFELARMKGWHRPPKHVPHLYMFGVTTVGAPPDRCEGLQWPYAQSGIFLAPVVKGYTQLFRSRKRTKGRWRNQRYGK